MSDTQAAMREFRFLDEKRTSTGLTPAEEERWLALAAELGIDLSQAQAPPEEQPAAPQGYYGQDGQWYPYPPPQQGYDPAVWAGAPGAWPGYYAPPQGYYDPNTGAWYPYPPPPTYYDPTTGAYYPMPQAYGYPPQWGPPQGQGYDPSQQQGWPQPQPGYPPQPWPGQGPWPQQPQAPAEGDPGAWAEQPPEGAAEPLPAEPEALVSDAPHEVASDEVMEIQDEEVVEIPAPAARAPALSADPVADLRQALSMDDDLPAAAPPAYESQPSGLLADIDPLPSGPPAAQPPPALLGELTPEPTSKLELPAFPDAPTIPLTLTELDLPEAPALGEPEAEPATEAPAAVTDLTPVMSGREAEAPAPLGRPSPSAREPLGFSTAPSAVAPPPASLEPLGFSTAPSAVAPPPASHGPLGFSTAPSAVAPPPTAFASAPLSVAAPPSATAAAPPTSAPAPLAFATTPIAFSLSPATQAAVAATPAVPSLGALPSLAEVPTLEAEPVITSAFDGLALPPEPEPIPSFTPLPTPGPSREAVFDDSWHETPPPSAPRPEKPGPPVPEGWGDLEETAGPEAPLELAGPGEFVPWNEVPTPSEELPLEASLGDFEVVSGSAAVLATGLVEGTPSSYDDQPLQLATNAEFIPGASDPGMGEPFSLADQAVDLSEEALVEGEVIQGEPVGPGEEEESSELDLDVEDLLRPSAPPPAVQSRAPAPAALPAPTQPFQALTAPPPAPLQLSVQPQTQPFLPLTAQALAAAPASSARTQPFLPLAQPFPPQAAPQVSVQAPAQAIPQLAQPGPTFRASGPLGASAPSLSPPGAITAAALANRLGALPSPVPNDPPASAGPMAPGRAEDAAVQVPGEHRVILHTMEGGVKRGAIKDANLTASQVVLFTNPGVSETVLRERVKAIFFMLAPGSRAPAPDGLKVRVTFRDGRQVAGFSRDHRSGAAGFFVVPADARTNTERIFIYRHGVTSVSVEG